jgi:GAF domain-containing protein
MIVNIPDAYSDDRFNKAMDLKTGFRTRSILCMAITNHRKERVGVLQVINKKAGYVFDEPDEKLLAAFSAQAAVALENSRLFQQTEKALNHALADQRNLKFMLSVTKNLFSDMHLTSMIDQMTMQVHHLLKADDCALYLVDSRKKKPSPVAAGVVVPAVDADVAVAPTPVVAATLPFGAPTGIASKRSTTTRNDGRCVGSVAQQSFINGTNGESRHMSGISGRKSSLTTSTTICMGSLSSYGSNRVKISHKMIPKA